MLVKKRFFWSYFTFLSGDASLYQIFLRMFHFLYSIDFFTFEFEQEDILTAQ